MNYEEQEANRQSWIKTSAERHRTDSGYSGHVRFAECQICGNMVWASTSRDGSGHSIDPMMPGDCHHCRESMTRSPELATWAINVAHKAAMDAVREMLASNSAIGGNPFIGTNKGDDHATRPKLCPFCGSEDIKCTGGISARWVFCQVCEATGPTGVGENKNLAQDDAIKRWNERVKEQP